jgi:hypothetical protein
MYRGFYASPDRFVRRTLEESADTPGPCLLHWRRHQPTDAIGEPTHQACPTPFLHSHQRQDSRTVRNADVYMVNDITRERGTLGAS